MPCLPHHPEYGSAVKVRDGIFLHALEGKPAITGEATLNAIAQLRDLYGLHLTVDDSHRHPTID